MFRAPYRTLGWSSVVLGPLLAGLGTTGAITSVRDTYPQFHFLGCCTRASFWRLLAERIHFAGFLTAGVLTRKMPRIHRNMMLMARLSILPGATARIRSLFSLFGTSGWMGLFSATYCVAFLVLALGWAVTRRFDTVPAWGISIWAATFTLATQVAMTPVWERIAAVIIR